MPRILLAPALACVVSLAAGVASAQRLSIQGDKFAIDGRPRFLTFISYFAAMDAPNIATDLRTLHDLGFDGLRIWPLLDTGPQLLNRDGSLRPVELARLRSILDTARLEGLIVDVTFTHEHITGMTPAQFRTGIANTAEALRSYENILFDIQNERNVGDRRFLSEADVGSTLLAIRAVHPERIVTASNSIGDDSGGRDAADFTARMGLDVTALHESRGGHWFTEAFYNRIIGDMRSNGKPAYLQEPNRTRDSRWAANDRAEYLFQAIANAKRAGAAAWCFHTMVAVDWRDGGSPFLEDRLKQFREPEWTFVTSLRPRIMLRASNGLNFVVAEGGGGARVRADRTAAGPGFWNTWEIAPLDGGPILSGDRVSLAAPHGHRYLQAISGGGGDLRAVSTAVGAWESFVIDTSSGGMMRDGDTVSLRTAGSTWYVTAAGGGGGMVTAAGASRGGWETFTVLFVPH